MMVDRKNKRFLSTNIFYKHPALFFEFHPESVSDQLLHSYKDDS